MDVVSLIVSQSIAQSEVKVGSQVAVSVLKQALDIQQETAAMLIGSVDVGTYTGSGQISSGASGGQVVNVVA